MFLGSSWNAYILQLNGGKWSWNNATAEDNTDYFMRYGQGYRALTNLTAGTGWKGAVTTSTGAITLFSSGGYYAINGCCYKARVYEGVVLAFRRGASPCDRVTVPLKGLPAGAKVRIENLDTGMRATTGGTLEITLRNRRSSTVAFYSCESN